MFFLKGEDDGKIKKRNVGEALTAGTVIEPQHLPGIGTNYIMCIASSGNKHTTFVYFVYFSPKMMSVRAEETLV